MLLRTFDILRGVAGVDDDLGVLDDHVVVVVAVIGGDDDDVHFLEKGRGELFRAEGRTVDAHRGDPGVVVMQLAHVVHEQQFHHAQGGGVPGVVDVLFERHAEHEDVRVFHRDGQHADLAENHVFHVEGHALVGLGGESDEVGLEIVLPRDPAQVIGIDKNAVSADAPDRDKMA
jgi:hypothetical protein